MMIKIVFIDKIKVKFKKTKKIINWFMAIQAINDAGGWKYRTTVEDIT